MSKYLTKEQLTTHLRLGKAVEQWLGFVKDEYTTLKWLRLDTEKDGRYSVAYFECFDEEGDDLLDIYEFSPLDPDEPFGIINSFGSVEEALNFSDTTYHALADKYVSAGMIQEEYKHYLKLQA